MQTLFQTTHQVYVQSKGHIYQTEKNSKTIGYYHVTLKINGINFHFTVSEEIEETKLQGHKLTDK